MIRNISYIFIFLLLLSFFKNEVYGEESEKTVINAIGYSDEEEPVYLKIADDFNKYAEENNIDIYINMKVVQKSDSFEAFGSQVEQTLKKKNNKYDIYYYDNGYTQKYGPYLLNLKKYLSKDHIGIYDPKILEMACEYDDALVGLPFMVTFSLLYSNNKLLKKYDKPIPQTWDELIETSLYIKERENDPELILYNGLMDESENGLCSVYEFIHSCRDSPEDPFPEINSKTTAKALELIKKLKSEIASDEIFKQNILYSANLLLQGKGLFVKFYTLTYAYLDVIPYTPSVLPGIKKGVSGSIIAGYNIGIDKNIKPEKLEAALTVFKHLTSKEFQKKYFLIENNITGITSLYDDEEINKKVNCTIYKNIQPSRRPVSKYYDFTEYSERVTNYMYQYLYEEHPVEEVLEKVDDLTKFHNVSIYNSDSKLLAYIYVILIALLVIVLISTIPFIFVEKYKPFYTYYDKELWIIITLGMLILLGASITTFGNPTKFKCNMYIVSVILGYTFVTVPFLYKYIIDFPKKNNISIWVYNNKYIFLAIFLLIDMIIIFIISINKLYVHGIFINEGKNYKICRYNSTFSLALPFILYIMIIAGLVILSYVEWFRRTYCYDIRNNCFFLYANVLAIILLFIFYFISVENYIVYFAIKNTLNIVVVLSGIISLYVLRYFAYVKKTEFNNINVHSSNVSSSITKSVDTVSSDNSNFIMKLREYHNLSKNDSCSNCNCDEQKKVAIQIQKSVKQ